MRYGTCSKCKKEKHETEFYSNGSGKLRSECKACTKASRRSGAYKAAQLAYDRSEKGLERKRRYSRSQAGKNRNLDYYWGDIWFGGSKPEHREECLNSAMRRRQISRIKRYGGEFKETNQANYGSFFKLLSSEEMGDVLANGSGPYGGDMEGSQ